MEYVSLINQLTELDKKRLSNYLTLYGASFFNEQSLDNWLCYWDHSKQKMFKALGNSLIKEFPYHFAKSDKILSAEYFDLMDMFFASYRNYINIFIDQNGIKDAKISLRKLIDINSLKNNAIGFNLKILLNNGKILQLQEDMKVVRALNRIIDAFKKTVNESELKETEKTYIENFFNDFEEFKKTYSIITNEKYINGTLCFSIHPLDFITMSDNSFRWSSCMSWTAEGCYRTGTIEMMNSNNTICAYIKSKNQKYNFSLTEKDKTYSPNKKIINSKEYEWNNKKWRQIFYITKDIVMGGKSYPFCFDEKNQITILDFLKNLINENLNWNYSFGPELYKDMIHIHSKYRMDNNRDWINNNTTIKHNILFDTNIMYNDMLNDTNFPYYCYRNKVKRNKIISVSGKANCICCNNDLKQEDKYTHDYNDRFARTEKVICEDCFSKIPQCITCFISNPTEKYYKVISKRTGEIGYCCERCFESTYKKCSFCGDNYDPDTFDILSINNFLFSPLYGNDYDNHMSKFLTNVYSFDSKCIKNNYLNQYKTLGYNSFEALWCCPDCLQKFTSSKYENKIWKKIKVIPYKFLWDRETAKIKIKKKEIKVVIDNDIKEKMLYDNIKNATLNNDNICELQDLPSNVKQVFRLISEEED